MIRCHTYKERPAQADMLHFDLWWRGENILRDTGSYSYYCPGPWKSYFNGTVAHNTITVDGRNQMTRGPRFMWFDWTRSRFRLHEQDDDAQTECWEGEHDGYRKRLGITHRRRVERHPDGSWTVTDDLLGSGNHVAGLFWHLGDWKYEWDEGRSLIKCRTPVGKVWLRVFTEGCETSRTQIVRGFANDQAAQGWESLYYGEKQEAVVFVCVAIGPCPMRLVTRIGLGKPPPA